MGVGGSLPPLGSAGVSEKGFWDVEIHLVDVGVELLQLGLSSLHAVGAQGVSELILFAEQTN